MTEVESTQKVTPQLMFEGAAEEAIEFYTSLFDDAEVASISRYGPGDDGAEGTVEQATFTLAGEEFRAIDSDVAHEFTFTPAISLFVACESAAEVDDLFEAFSADGEVLMPLDSYPFAERFAWVADRYGVSWQLSLS